MLGHFTCDREHNLDHQINRGEEESSINEKLTMTFVNREGHQESNTSVQGAMNSSHIGTVKKRFKRSDLSSITSMRIFRK